MADGVNWQTGQVNPQGALPQTNPIQGPPDVDEALKQQALQQSQMGTQAFGQQLQQNQGLQQQLQGLQQQQANLPVPPMGYHPNFQPMDSAGHVLGDVGKALLLGLSATGPGRAVQQAYYGPGVERYETQRGALAQQISEIQGQQKTGTEALGAESNMSTRSGMVIPRIETAETGRMNAQTRQVAEQHHNAVEMEGNRIKQQLGQGKLTQEQARTQMMGIIARETNGARRDVANILGNTRESVEQQQAAEQDFKEMSDHWLQNFLGMGPDKPVTTAAGRGGTRRAAPGGTAVPAGTVVYDPQGKAHKADGTHPLPQGWTTKK